jgi:hypothetical protein
MTAYSSDGTISAAHIHESNPHAVFGHFLNRNKLVCGSDLLLSFNRPLLAGD